MRNETIKKYIDKYSLGVVETHNSLAQYNSFYRNMGFNEAIEDLITEKLKQKKPVRVLDIGCGNGGFLADIKGIFLDNIHTIGVDLLAPSKQPDEEVTGDALEAAFPGDIDLAFSFRTLHEIGAPEEMIAKVYDSLAPRGKAFLSFRTMDLYTGSEGIAELGEKEVKALQKMVRSCRLSGFKVEGFEVRVNDEKGNKLTAGVNIFLEK